MSTEYQQIETLQRLTKECCNPFGDPEAGREEEFKIRLGQVWDIWPQAYRPELEAFLEFWADLVTWCLIGGVTPQNEAAFRDALEKFKETLRLRVCGVWQPWEEDWGFKCGVDYQADVYLRTALKHIEAAGFKLRQLPTKFCVRLRQGRVDYWEKGGPWQAVYPERGAAGV